MQNTLANGTAERKVAEPNLGQREQAALYQAGRAFTERRVLSSCCGTCTALNSILSRPKGSTDSPVVSLLVWTRLRMPHSAGIVVDLPPSRVRDDALIELALLIAQARNPYSRQRDSGLARGADGSVDTGFLSV